MSYDIQTHDLPHYLRRYLCLPKIEASIHSSKLQQANITNPKNYFAHIYESLCLCSYLHNSSCLQRYVRGQLHKSEWLFENMSSLEYTKCAVYRPCYDITYTNLSGSLSRHRDPRRKPLIAKFVNLTTSTAVRKHNLSVSWHPNSWTSAPST